MGIKVLTVGGDGRVQEMSGKEFEDKYTRDYSRDKRLAALKKDDTVPNVGDTVVLNDCGLEQCFGSALGVSHMKTLKMKITKVDDESLTCPEPTFAIEVDNEEINQFLLDHHCIDKVK